MLSGKDPTHIDRVGAQVAREMAMVKVQEGAPECWVRLFYAPGLSEPIDLVTQVYGVGYT